MKTIDLRSDTVTRPTAAMRAAMAAAEVGDDVYGEDPTVNLLERRAAELSGHEAALFVSSGTQGNLLALLSHCQRGDEYIVGQLAHSYRSEGGGAAALGGIQPQPIEQEPDGRLDLDRVEQAVKPVDFHYARTRLICLENTWRGMVAPLDYLQQARRLADRHGLALHLDGARVFNATVKLGIEPRQMTALFDSLSFCLSKGLGAPVGSMLCGSEALIGRARRWRKVVGGGMRQAGVLAAAGLFALDQHIERLGEDHDNAARLARGLAAAGPVDTAVAPVETNMVFARVPEPRREAYLAFMADRGIRLGRGSPMRLVTHLDISADDVDYVVESTREFFH
ncbi:MAG: low-specificity L-threonine aldolase [Ectothiorhodospiraceae bacterium]|nr:low-specificity L-threonine aldolase [Chromatiales bacterium]MCP5155452.1 low-specificity L-threonine aldolase [Ectothiorhodospiraceae bacterium]